MRNHIERLVERISCWLFTGDFARAAERGREAANQRYRGVGAWRVRSLGLHIAPPKLAGRREYIWVRPEQNASLPLDPGAEAFEQAMAYGLEEIGPVSFEDLIRGFPPSPRL